MYSVISSSIVDLINNSAYTLDKYQHLPDNHEKISVLHFYLKRFYNNGNHYTGARNKQNKQYIFSLLDKYHNPSHKDLLDIIKLVIKNDDLELFKILFKNYYLTLDIDKMDKLYDRLVDKMDIFYESFITSSFKILNYYLDETKIKFWDKCIEYANKFSEMPLNLYMTNNFYHILRKNLLTIDIKLKSDNHLSYNSNNYVIYEDYHNQELNYLITFSNKIGAFSQLIQTAIYMSNDVKIFNKYIVNICSNYRVDLLKDFIINKKYYFTNYLTMESFAIINDHLHKNKLEEYEQYEEIPYNRHKYISTSIINILKLLLPFVDTPNNYTDLRYNFQSNLNYIITLQHAVQLLKKIEHLNLNYESYDDSNYYIIQDMFKYGTYDTITYIMKTYQETLVSPSSFGESCKMDLFESIITTCYNNDERVLKIYLEFLDSLYYSKEIMEYICNCLNRGINSTNKTEFKLKLKNFKKKIYILIDFIDKYNATQDNKDTFFTNLLYSCIKDNNYHASKFILSHQFTIKDYYIFFDITKLLHNDDKQYNKISQINRQLISKFEINDDFIKRYHYLIELAMNTYCYCYLSKFLKYLWSKLSKKQLEQCQNEIIEHNKKKHTYYLHGPGIIKTIENTSKCQYCNPDNKKIIDNNICLKIINLYKETTGQNKNDIVYIPNLFKSWNGTYVDWEYYRILYLNGFRHKYDFESPLYIIQHLLTEKDTFKTKCKKYKMSDTNYYNCSLKIINFQLCIQYLRQKYLKKYHYNVTNFKNTIQNINNEFKYCPPIKCNNLANVLGLEFKKNMGNICRKNPIHITPSHLLDPQINQKYIFFTEKADGITKTGLSPNIFPEMDCFDNYHNFVFDLENIEYEYIESLNICMVFNVYHTDKSLVENLIYLRYIHPYVPNYDSQYFTINNHQKYDLEHILKFQSLEKECFDKYISDNKHRQQTLWWPKMIFTYENDNIIEYLQNLHQITTQNLDIFPTDGWILYSHHPEEDILKIKPYHHLTIDLKYTFNNQWRTYDKQCIKVINDQQLELILGNIHRCYYSDTLNNWVVRELRMEKKNPNNSEICQSITQHHHHKWNIEDIINLYRKKPYYINHRININKTIHPHQKYDISQLISLIQNKKSVLDIGCGYKAKTLKKKFAGKYVGLDSDINVLENPNVYAFDMCQLWSKQLDSFGNIYYYLKTLDNISLIDTKFDTILCLNAIHYAFKDQNTMTNFQQNIEYFGTAGTLFIVRYLDSIRVQSLFDQNNNKIVHENGSFVRYNSAETITIYYNWVHQTPLIETRINLNKLKNSFPRWNYQNELSDKLNHNKFRQFKQIKDNGDDIWAQYFNCFTYAVFIRE